MRHQVSMARTSPPRDDVAATNWLYCSISGGCLLEYISGTQWGDTVVDDLLVDVRQRHVPHRPDRHPRCDLGRRFGFRVWQMVIQNSNFGLQSQEIAHQIAGTHPPAMYPIAQIVTHVATCFRGSDLWSLVSGFEFRASGLGCCVSGFGVLLLIDAALVGIPREQKMLK